MRGSTLPALSKALEWGAEGGDPVTARLVPLDCKPGRAACEAVLPEEQQAEKQVHLACLKHVSFGASSRLGAEGLKSRPSLGVSRPVAKVAAAFFSNLYRVVVPNVVQYRPLKMPGATVSGSDRGRHVVFRKAVAILYVLLPYTPSESLPSPP